MILKRVGMLITELVESWLQIHEARRKGNEGSDEVGEHRGIPTDERIEFVQDETCEVETYNERHCPHSINSPIKPKKCSKKRMIWLWSDHTIK